MGIYVELYIRPDRIDAASWQAFYRDSLRFLQAFPGEVVGLREIKIDQWPQFGYSRDIEHHLDDPRNRHWRIVGTRVGLKMAEDFRLYFDLDYYRQEYHPPVDAATDILAGMPDSQDALEPVFSAKTQGEPYHFALLAVGMLAEAAFPGNALTMGDIDDAQARRAAEHLREILDREVAPPLLTDAKRLLKRILAEDKSVAALDRYDALFRGDASLAIATVVELVEPALATRWLEQRLKEYSPKQMGFIKICIHWLSATQDLRTLCEIAALSPTGPRADPLDLAAALVSTGVTLTPEEGEGLRIAVKPSGSAGSVYEQLGGALFDAGGLSARQSTCFLGEEFVCEVLGRLFPDRIEELRERIHERTRGLREMSSTVHDTFVTLGNRVEVEPETGDGSSLLAYQPDQELSERQAGLLEGVAEAFRAMRSDLEAEPGLFPGEDRKKQAIDFLLYQRKVALTEESWQWIAEEQDQQMLNIILFVLLIDQQSLLFFNVRRAILEHRPLCEWVRRKIEELGDSPTPST